MEKKKSDLSVKDLLISIENVEELATTAILWCGLLRQFLKEAYGIEKE